MVTYCLIKKINHKEKINKNKIDYCDIIGQIEAKRAMEIAAAGRHNIYMLFGSTRCR